MGGRPQNKVGPMRGKEPIEQQNFDTSSALRAIPTVSLLAVFKPSKKLREPSFDPRSRKPSITISWAGPAVYRGVVYRLIPPG